MSMGRREVERQGLLWVATGDAAQGPRQGLRMKTWTELVC